MKLGKLDNVQILHIDVKILRQHATRIITAKTGVLFGIEMHDTGEFTEAVTIEFCQHKVCVILAIHTQDFTQQTCTYREQFRTFLLVIIVQNLFSFVTEQVMSTLVLLTAQPLPGTASRRVALHPQRLCETGAVLLQLQTNPEYPCYQDISSPMQEDACTPPGKPYVEQRLIAPPDRMFRAPFCVGQGFALTVFTHPAILSTCLFCDAMV
ncbi:MAG: hypothetical protein HKN70_09980 [Gammaproteobacteria bacterium]|nr:hypothetical protein [Gammaproteobacteria bacterium]